MASLAHLRAALASLCIGAVCFVSGVRVERTSLLGFTIDRGSNVEIDEAPEEIECLAAERQSIQEEPSLLRAAEIATRRMWLRGVRGEYRIRNRVARWSSTEGSSPRIDREALQEFVEWCAYLGVEAAIVGNEAIEQTYTIGRAA